jgi:hypothetical protein
VSGGDFFSRAEAQLCGRRRIEDRIDVVRDLRRVEKHLGAIAAADQLGLPLGGIETICNRKAAIGPSLLAAMYGAGGARLLPSLAPRDTLDAQFDKIVAAAGARAVKPAPDAAALARGPRHSMMINAAPQPSVIRKQEVASVVAEAAVAGSSVAPFDKLRVSGSLTVAKGVPVTKPCPVVAVLPPAPAKPAPGPIVGARERDAHECKVLGEVGTTRPALVAILQRARKHYGTWVLAGEALGIGSSSIQNLAGNHAKFSFRTASVLLDWDRANSVLRQAQDDSDAGAAADTAVVDRGAAEVPPPAQNSTAAPLVEPSPPEVPRAVVDGALAVPPPPAPQTIPALVAANDDLFAVALTAMVKARDAASIAAEAIAADRLKIEAQIAPLQARWADACEQEKRLRDRLSVLCHSVERLQAAAQ